MHTFLEVVQEIKKSFDNADDVVRALIENDSEATSIATSSHTTGSYLIYNKKLYRVVDDIAVGDTLDPTPTTGNIEESDDIIELIESHTVTTDPIPTQGSQNPVQSGGVYTKLGDKLPTYTADSTAWDSTPTANSTKPVTSGGLKTAIDGKSHVEVDESGTASSSTTRDFTISVDSGADHIIRRYMEQTKTVSTSNDTTYTFTNAAITADSVIDVYASEFGVNPSNVSVTVSNNIGTCTVTIPKQSSAISLGIRIYIK